MANYLFSLSFFCAMALATAIPSSGLWYNREHLGHAAVGSDQDDSLFSCPNVGKFPLQSNCTAYIYCGESLTATVVACPSCVEDSDRCPEGRMHFDDVDGECKWPQEVSSERCGHRPTTPPSTTTTPAPGSPCVPECTQFGRCLCYSTCVADNSTAGGHWELRYCPEPLFWNPDLTPHGGTCDKWEHLSQAVQDYYRSLGFDECPVPELDCYWEAHKTCHNQYWYLPVGSHNENEKQLVTCPEGLWWSQKATTCVNTCPHASGCNACS